MQSFLDEELVEHETTARDVEHLFPMTLWRFCDKFVTMQQQNTTTTPKTKQHNKPMQILLAIAPTHASHCIQHTLCQRPISTTSTWWGACKTGRVQVRAFRGRNKKQERVVKCLHECWHGSSTHRLQIAASFLGHALRLGRKSMGWSSWSVWSSGRSSRLILGFLWIFQGTWVSRAGSQWMWRTRKLLRSWRTECVRKLIMWYQSEHVILCNIHIFTLLSKWANNSSIGFENIRHCVEFLMQY